MSTSIHGGDATYGKTMGGNSRGVTRSANQKYRLTRDVQPPPTGSRVVVVFGGARARARSPLSRSSPQMPGRLANLSRRRRRRIVISDVDHFHDGGRVRFVFSVIINLSLLHLVEELGYDDVCRRGIVIPR